MSELYEFDSFRMDAVRRVLLRDGKPVPMSNKAFEVLLVLVQERERVLPVLGRPFRILHLDQR